MTMIGLSDRVAVAGGGLASWHYAAPNRSRLRHHDHDAKSRPALIQTFFHLVNDAKLHASRATAR
jgi:hypothetical protein